MESTTTIPKSAYTNTRSIDNLTINDFVNLQKASKEKSSGKRVTDILKAEGYESFADYIEWLGIANESNSVVLPCFHHYYYDEDEIRNIEIVINLKELNLVKKMKTFLPSISRVLPQKCKFIGCFTDNEKVHHSSIRYSSQDLEYAMSSDAIENGIISKNPFLNRLYNIIDLKKRNYLTKESVSLLLETNCFKVRDMTEFNGITYFLSQKVSVSGS